MKAPRSARRLLTATFELYRRYPWLFLTLAAVVTVPYDLIALAATGAGPFSRGDASIGTRLAFDLADWALVTPLVSALHVHAVADVGRDREPRIGAVALRGLRVLPVVAAATIASWVGIAAGFFALIVPGVFLLLRWAVVAQVAAIEHDGWLPALRRSGQLSKHRYLHIAALLIMVGAITTAPFLAAGAFFGDHESGAGAFLVGVLLRVMVASFSALAVALLYFDLLARWELRREPQAEQVVATTSVASTPRTLDLDPGAFDDRDRPEGWYVDPASPNRMHYWAAGEPAGWQASARTPWRVRRAWRAQQQDASDG
jgi:hypothetical protein